MARKSRKNTNIAVNENDKKNTVYSAALYIRLSIEDNKKRGNSIETQTSILQNFVALNPDIKKADTYIDNGTTGTNFERPQFKRMISDIENKKINCVIVKDLSRLGRNAIDTGFYIEKYFPSYNVRFISVNDDFDTNKENGNSGIILPLKNMINEAYSIDIGRKIKAQAHQSMKAGEYIGARPPYGYIKDPDNCHKLIVDEEPAKIVKQIFQWKYDGISYNQIAKRLNETNIMTPNRYAQSKGIINHKTLMGSGYWQTRTIQAILSNECYTGDMVQGKAQYINHKKIDIPKEQWIRVKNTHEPIISHELFDAVNEKRRQIAEKYKNISVERYNENILKGKVFCGHCGRNLNRNKNHKGEYVFHCLANERIAKNTCLNFYISEKYIIENILKNIQNHSDIILSKKQELKKNILSKTDNSECDYEILKLKQSVEKNRMFLKSLYESLVNKIITDDEYFEMKQEYESKISFALSKISSIEKSQKDLRKKIKDYNNAEKHIAFIHNKEILTAELADKLIDKVLVYSDKRVDVFFNFDDKKKEDDNIE